MRMFGWYVGYLVVFLVVYIFCNVMGLLVVGDVFELLYNKGVLLLE